MQDLAAVKLRRLAHYGRRACGSTRPAGNAYQRQRIDKSASTDGLRGVWESLARRAVRACRATTNIVQVERELAERRGNDPMSGPEFACERMAESVRGYESW